MVDPQRTNHHNIAIASYEAFVIMEAEEWAVVYDILDQVRLSTELGEDARQFLRKLQVKVRSFVRNSGHSEFPVGYLDEDEEDE